MPLSATIAIGGRILCRKSQHTLKTMDGGALKIQPRQYKLDFSSGMS